MPDAQIGILGGSGLYRFDGLADAETIEVSTPFGPPSAPVVAGRLGCCRVAFLPRHGVGHYILPSEVPARANIWAFKSLGVERVVAVSAVGSLREDIHPLDFIVPDQLIDRTRGRPSTFFGGGLAVHIAFADPFCEALRQAVADALEAAGASVARGGAYVVMEGPAFSTRAESNLYRSWGASVVGMTALPEAKLAREAEMCYAAMGAVTDYDCWHQDEADVTVEVVVENLQRNAAAARRAIAVLLERGLPERTCACGNALGNAIITAPGAIPESRKQELSLIIGRYIS